MPASLVSTILAAQSLTHPERQNPQLQVPASLFGNCFVQRIALHA